MENDVRRSQSCRDSYVCFHEYNPIANQSDSNYKYDNEIGSSPSATDFRQQIGQSVVFEAIGCMTIMSSKYIAGPSNLTKTNHHCSVRRNYR